MPDISIVTVTLNSDVTLQQCISSVAEQRGNIEHIVIDGESSDQTLRIIQENADHLSQWISEPDDGIYSAMNKGLALASGDIVGILNSDDFYVDDLALERVRKALAEDSIDACYADLSYVDSFDTTKVRRRWKSQQLSPKDFYWGAMPPHPTFFVKKRVYDELGDFRKDLGSAADYEFMLRVLVRAKKNAVYVPHTLVHMRAGGASNESVRARWLANRMDRRAWSVNGLRPYPFTLILKPIRKIPQWIV